MVYKYVIKNKLQLVMKMIHMALDKKEMKATLNYFLDHKLFIQGRDEKISMQ